MNTFASQKIRHILAATSLQPRPMLAQSAIAVASLALATSTASSQWVEPDAKAIYTFTGEAPGDSFGWVANTVGDLNGDGFNDILIGAPGNDHAAFNGGRAYIYSGADGTLLFEPMSGTHFNGAFGFSVGAAGDINSDGTIDLIVGAPNNAAGRAWILSGVDGSVIDILEGENAGDQFGFSVAGIGDIDGDNIDDIAVGAPGHDAGGSNAGRIYVFSGKDRSIICTFDGEASGDLLGTALVGIQDLNNDGVPDLAAAGRNAGPIGGGAGFVFSGAGCNEVLFPLEPTPPASNFGWFFMDDAGDVNNDGTTDIYVGDFSANRAHVFSGVDGSTIWIFDGEGEGGGFGIGRGAGDLNGDSHADLVLAAWTSDVGAPDAGKVFVYSGKSGKVLQTMTHTIPGATFGFDAAGMLDDLNGDGKMDFLITAASDQNNRGTVYVMAGAVGPVVGDLNGDGAVGVSDLLLLLAAWGACGDCAPGKCPADLDGDCAVGVSDLLVLLSNWG